MQRQSAMAASFLGSVLGLAFSCPSAVAQTAPPPPPQQQQPYPQQQQGYEPPPPPQRREPEEESAFPDFSLRADPLRWLIGGRLPLEIEVQPLKALSFLTVQVVPIFVTWSSPPALNLQDRDDNLTQHSNGWGPMSGASFGLGFWLGGKPFKGYVLRAAYTNYSYEYKTRDGEGDLLDHVTYVERQILGEFGSYSRYGAFIIGGTLQLGVELNDKSRCVRATSTKIVPDETQQHCEDLQIVVDDTRPPGEVVNLRSSYHPVVLNFSFTLGVAF